MPRRTLTETKSRASTFKFFPDTWQKLESLARIKNVPMTSVLDEAIKALYEQVTASK